jgi:hypothetical protein
MDKILIGVQAIKNIAIAFGVECFTEGYSWDEVVNKIELRSASVIANHRPDVDGGINFTEIKAFKRYAFDAYHRENLILHSI